MKKNKLIKKMKKRTCYDHITARFTVPLRFTQIPETKPSLAKFQKLRKPAGRYKTYPLLNRC